LEPSVSRRVVASPGADGSDVPRTSEELGALWDHGMRMDTKWTAEGKCAEVLSDDAGAVVVSRIGDALRCLGDGDSLMLSADGMFAVVEVFDVGAACVRITAEIGDGPGALAITSRMDTSVGEPIADDDHGAPIYEGQMVTRDVAERALAAIVQDATVKGLVERGVSFRFECDMYPWLCEAESLAGGGQSQAGS